MSDHQYTILLFVCFVLDKHAKLDLYSVGPQVDMQDHQNTLLLFVCFVLDQHAKLDFYSVGSTGRHVGPLEHRQTCRTTRTDYSCLSALYQTNTLSWIFLVLGPQEDMSDHQNTLLLFVCFVLDQHAKLDLYSVGSTGRHVGPLEHRQTCRTTRTHYSCLSALYQTNTLSWIFVVLGPQVDMSDYQNTLLLFVCFVLGQHAKLDFSSVGSTGRHAGLLEHITLVCLLCIRPTR